jgi:hypothetical protein
MNDWEGVNLTPDGSRSDQQADGAPRRRAKQPFLRRGEGVQRRMTAYQRRQPSLTPQPQQGAADDGAGDLYGGGALPAHQKQQRQHQQQSTRGWADQTPPTGRSGRVDNGNASDGGGSGSARGFDADAPSRGSSSPERGRGAAAGGAKQGSGHRGPPQEQDAWWDGTAGFEDNHEEDDFGGYGASLDQHGAGGLRRHGLQDGSPELVGQTRMVQEQPQRGYMQQGFDFDPTEDGLDLNLDAATPECYGRRYGQPPHPPPRGFDWEGVGYGGGGPAHGDDGSTPLTSTPLSCEWETREAEEVRGRGCGLKKGRM